MQHPDPVNSTDKPEPHADAPSESGFNATDPTIFHNPNLLSKGQVGEGYRLLTKAEFENPGDPSSVTEFWHRGDEVWDERSHPGDALADVNTYRVPVADELGVGARVRVIGTPWGFPVHLSFTGKVGYLVDIDLNSSARYLVRFGGDSVWFAVGAIDRDYAEAGTPPAAPRTFRFKEGDRVTITGPTICYDGSEVGNSGVVRVVDRDFDDGYPYRVAVGGDELNLRWFPESSLAPAESIEDDPPDTYVDEIPAQVKPAVYVSAHFPDAAQADRVASILNRAGYLVVSTWHAGESDSTPAAAAARDFAQLDKADAVVLLSTPHRTTGGKFVEAGYALGKGKPVFVLGTRENWMMHHPKVSVFATVEELLNTGAL